jgi:hypothetical protein
VLFGVGAEDRAWRGKGQDSPPGLAGVGGPWIGTEQVLHCGWVGDHEQRSRSEETDGEDVAVALLRLPQEGERVAVEGHRLREHVGVGTGWQLGGWHRQ